MKKLLFGAFLAVLLFSIFSSFCWAQGFTNMTNKELFDLRGTIKYSVEDVKKAYNEEWEKRLDSMSDEEKNKYAEAEEKKIGEVNQLWTPGQGYDPQGKQGNLMYGGTFQGTGKPKKVD